MARTSFVKMPAALAIGVFLTVTGCGPTLTLTQFQDVGRQKITNNRAVFQLDVDLSPIFEAEGSHPKEIASVKNHGNLYISARGFRNVYCVALKDSKTAKFEVVKLRRNESVPFDKVAFDWAEKDQITFKWKDAQGVHVNVIDKKGKARLM